MLSFVVTRDKANHFLYGVCVTLFVLLTTQSPCIALAFSIFSGIAKECTDFALNIWHKNDRYHDVEMWDALATVLGGVCISLAANYTEVYTFMITITNYF